MQQPRSPHAWLGETSLPGTDSMSLSIPGPVAVTHAVLVLGVAAFQGPHIAAFAASHARKRGSNG